jgi:hypothetical protein
LYKNKAKGMMKITALVLLGSLPFLTMAQDKIESDRPTESQNASLVGKGTFQVESGLRKDQENNRDYSVQHPNAILRYGLVDRLELRLETTVETQRYYTKNKFNYGLEPVELGVKAHVYHTKDTSFSSTLYGLIGLSRMASKDHKHDDTYYRVRLLFENELSDKIKLTYNVGRDWDSDERQHNWIYTFSPQIQLTDKWDLFVEGFGYLQKGNKPEHYIDGGLTYYINNNLALDLDVGKGVSSKSVEYFMTAGVSFKIK